MILGSIILFKGTGAALPWTLIGGATAFPVYLEKHLLHLDPPVVGEGHHRLLAFSELGLPVVPVFVMKYADE